MDSRSYHFAVAIVGRRCIERIVLILLVRGLLRDRRCRKCPFGRVGRQRRG